MTREIRALLAPWLRSPWTGLLLALAPVLETAVFAALVASAGHTGRAATLAGTSARHYLFASLVTLAAVLPVALAPLYAAAALATDREDFAAGAAARAGSWRFDCALWAELGRALCLVWASAPPVLLAYVVLRPANGVALCIGLHAHVLLAVTASTAAAALAPNRLVAAVSGYCAVISATGIVWALVWRLAPYGRFAGVDEALAVPALCAGAALGFLVMGRALARHRGAHYR